MRRAAGPGLVLGSRDAAQSSRPPWRLGGGLPPGVMDQRRSRGMAARFLARCWGQQLGMDSASKEAVSKEHPSPFAMLPWPAAPADLQKGGVWRSDT